MLYKWQGLPIGFRISLQIEHFFLRFNLCAQFFFRGQGPLLSCTNRGLFCPQPAIIHDSASKIVAHQIVDSLSPQSQGTIYRNENTYPLPYSAVNSFASFLITAVPYSERPSPFNSSCAIRYPNSQLHCTSARFTALYAAFWDTSIKSALHH